jgi:hypothetical protein
VPLGYSGATLSIGSHGFALGLASFWRQAFLDLSLAKRLPALTAPPIANLVSGLVNGAAANGLSGCAAVESVVCAAAGVTPCAVQAACMAALPTMSATLDAFVAPGGIDLQLTGQATVIDNKGDLQGHLLGSGTWSSPQLSSGNFNGLVQ